MIDVCICTHNPKRELFTLILKAITNQTLSKDAYQVWVVDNASDPAINDSDLEPLAQAGITYHLLQEKRLGTMYARELISQAVPGDSLILVDDDNELASNYLEVAVDILDRHPEIGYFGGKLLSGIKVDYPDWMNQVLPYLGIKDEGEEPLSQCVEGDYYWGKWEPPCAGAVIRKVVLHKYFEDLQKLPPNLVLGRQGKKGLLSLADSWLAHCTYQLGLQCSYQPRLQLTHHIDPERLKLEYFLRLLYNYGRSKVIFKKILNQPIDNNSIESMEEKISWWKNRGVSTGYFLCLLAWEAGFNDELSRDNPVDFFSLLDIALEHTEGVQREKILALETELSAQRQQIASLEAKIESIETSKLWRLQTGFLKIKKNLGFR